MSSQRQRDANRSYNYNRALIATLQQDLKEHPRDPIYFDYLGSMVTVVVWLGSEKLKRWSDGSTSVTVKDLKGQTYELVNTKSFGLRPLGRVRQTVDGALSAKDYFEPVPELDKLYKRLLRMIKRNQARWEEEDAKSRNYTAPV